VGRREGRENTAAPSDAVRYDPSTSPSLTRSGIKGHGKRERPERASELVGSIQPAPLSYSANTTRQGGEKIADGQ
jgi:hypothetical protein